MSSTNVISVSKLFEAKKGRGRKKKNMPKRVKGEVTGKGLWGRGC